MTIHTEPSVNFQNVNGSAVMVERSKSIARHALDNLDDDSMIEVISKALRDRPWRVVDRVLQAVRK